jgi:hypothetical protein
MKNIMQCLLTGFIGLSMFFCLIRFLIQSCVFKVWGGADGFHEVGI